VAQGRAERPGAVAAAWAAWRDYRDVVVRLLEQSPELAAARYAAVTFRCAICNRALRVAQSNGYGVGPECRSWMPEDLLSEYARQVSLLRANPAGGDRR
jgi:hypothetical protein